MEIIQITALLWALIGASLGLHRLYVLLRAAHRRHQSHWPITLRGTEWAAAAIILCLYISAWPLARWLSQLTDAEQ